MFKHVLTAGALAVGLTLVGSTAHAAKPDVVEQFHDQFTEPDEFITDLCGFDATFSVDDRGTFRAWDDGRVHVTAHGSFVVTNTENNKTLTREWRVNFKGQGSETVEDDILTIQGTDRYAGMPERWRDTDGKILIADTGLAIIDFEVVIDLETDELLHLHEAFDTRGPHPILEVGGLDPSLACGLLS